MAMIKCDGFHLKGLEILIADVGPIYGLLTMRMDWGFYLICMLNEEGREGGPAFRGQVARIGHSWHTCP